MSSRMSFVLLTLLVVHIFVTWALNIQQSATVAANCVAIQRIEKQLQKFDTAKVAKE
jgi:hypothetical protein